MPLSARIRVEAISTLGGRGFRRASIRRVIGWAAASPSRMTVLKCVLFLFASSSLVHTIQAGELSDLRIMTFNVWSAEGTSTGREILTDVIRASGADIVGLQEMGNAQGIQIAEALGYHYQQQSGSDTQILSRYPILERTRRAWGARIEISPGHDIWLFNAHLAAYPYQPYDLRDRRLAQNEAAVIAAANSARGSQVTSMLRDMEESGALASGDPVFLTGDFNEPSHLDWTQAAAEATDRPYDLKVDYPTSVRITEVGMIDSFREVRPVEPVPGVFDFAYTWTPGYPPPQVPANEVHDRIDIVYHRDGTEKPVIPTEALNLGPTADLDAEPWMTDLQVPRYNADHRAVVVEYDVLGLYGSSLTFSQLGPNGSVIDNSYGDRLVSTPRLQIDYLSNIGQWKFWEGENWDAGGAAFLDSGAGDPATGQAQFEVLLQPDEYYQGLFTEFDLLDWQDSDTVGHTVEWQIVDGVGILLEGVAEVPDDGSLTVSTGMTEPISGAMTLRLKHLAGFDNKLAIDNIAFDQGLLGDFNRNRILDAADIDTLSLEIRSAGGDLKYDLNGDALLDQMDRTLWVETLSKTYWGDSNLDGEFNTGDLVQVLEFGQYEDDLAGNSGWSEGDWDGDGDFTTTDLVKALEGGGYEIGPRDAALPVPEPANSGMALLLAAMTIFRACRRQRFGQGQSPEASAGVET